MSENHETVVVDERRKRRRFILIIIGATLMGFVFGITQLITADSWVNGTGYIYPNSSWSDNIKLNGSVRGTFGYYPRFDNDGTTWLNRTMNNTNQTYLYHNRTR